MKILTFTVKTWPDNLQVMLYNIPFFYIMGNTYFSSFHESMAFWSLKAYSGINIYFISKLWLFGIHFYHKPGRLLSKKYLPENLKCLVFLHNVHQNVHNFLKITKFLIIFWVWGYFKNALFLPLNLLYPQNLFLILSNTVYWANNILRVFSIFLQPYLLSERQKIENFQFLMLKFTISVSNLYMKSIWTTVESFTSHNHHMELSLPEFSET